MKIDTSKRISIRGFEEAVKTNQQIQIQLLISNSLGFVNHMEVLFNKYGQQTGGDLCEVLHYEKEFSNDEYSCFIATVQFNTPGYRTYVFRSIINGKEIFIKHTGDQENPVLTNDNYPFFETFVYEETFSTPDWVKGGIMYQIYPDTFCREENNTSMAYNLSEWGTEPKWRPDPDGEYRNDRFFGGNLRGVIAKLPYLKTLGVTILYFTPIFKSASSNRYDIVDYEKIDEMVGDWNILKELYDKAHEMGMHIVLDCVFNHCNPANHLYTEKPHLFTGNFWWGYKHLAEFYMDSEEFKNLVRKWLNLYLQYCDGIRLDVADSLSDSVLRVIRAEIKEIEKKLGKKIYLLGEVWKNAIKGDHRSFLHGDELDATMNYQFADGILRYVRWGDCHELKRKVFDDVLRLYPRCTIDVQMNPLSTHDIPRKRNILTNHLMVRERFLPNGEEAFLWDYDKNPCWTRNGVYMTYEKRCWEQVASTLTSEEEERASKMDKLSVAMQYTLPGVPSIFYGDELGVTGLKDPFNRVCMPWEKANYSEIKDFYISIGEFRKRYREIFAEGKCELVLLNESICIYKRISDNKSITCVFNRTGEEIRLEQKIEGHIVFSVNGSTNEVLNPYEALMIVS